MKKNLEKRNSSQLSAITEYIQGLGTRYLE